MMGERTVAQEALFYEFSLERHVPADHLLRSIDRFVDLSGLREELRPRYSEKGRPAASPRRRSGSPRAANARRSRCSSPISSASCASTVSDYAVPAAPATSSTSQLLPRTSASSPS